MARCEILEVQETGDAVGSACSRTASKKCSDCGVNLCEPHAETCAMCRDVFCPSCLIFHAEHAKPVAADNGRVRGRKTA
jgi:hypothetical protein